jgi:hypothetical protein
LVPTNAKSQSSGPGERRFPFLLWVVSGVGLGSVVLALCVWWVIAAHKQVPTRVGHETSRRDPAGKTPSNASRPDRDTLIKLGKKLAETKGLNPLAVVVEGDSIMVVSGRMRIANGAMGLSEGDMVYNVDSKAIVINEISLQPGECAAVRSGKVEKIPDRLKP